MEKKTASAIMLTLLLASLLTLAFNIQPVKASGTVYIRADGSVDPPTAPITAVGNVTYVLTDNVYDSVVVERDNILVDGAGYTVQGTGNWAGIDLSGRSNVTIKDTNIKGFSNGVYLYFSSNSTISENDITENSYGIMLIDSSNSTISGNHVANNEWGIRLYWCSNSTLKNNNATSNEYNFAVYGGFLSHYIQDIDTSNTVDGKPVHYWVNRQDVAVPSNAGYVALVNCTRIKLENLNLTNSGQGVLLAYTMNSTITKNNITDNWSGIEFYESSNNTISGNKITANHNGIVLDYSSNCNSIYGNNVTNNHEAIYLVNYSNYNGVYGNNITSNSGDGISIILSSYNSLYENNLVNNRNGIYLHESDSNLLTRNVAESNEGGIDLWNSGNNTLTSNNLTENSMNFVVSAEYLSCFYENIDSSNLINGKPIYYLVDLKNVTIAPKDYPNIGYLALVNGNNVIVENISLHDAGGLELAYSKNCLIDNVDITNSDFGILFYSSSNNTVNMNAINGNYVGIYFGYSANNTLFKNAILNNELGIYSFNSRGNRIYHNNFVENVLPQIFNYASVNIWDDGYPSGGNYWSDFIGVDADGDGIGDVPYIIDADNQDRYPLMHPWSSRPVHNINTGLGYATIQEAINANETQDGHTIYVEAGTYYEHVTINKSIALVGEDRTKTIIDGNGNGTVVLVIANNTMISGFTIRESGEIFDCSWNDVWCGIMVGGYETPFDNVTIMNNHIRNNYIGVLLWSSINSKIIDNNIENNTYGIIPFVVFRSDISHNNLSNGSFGINAQYVLQSNISNNTITSNEIAGLRMQDSSFNTIDGNYIENNWYGIDLSESDNNNITRNTLTSNEYGISLGRSGSNLIYHNNFIWNSIQVYNSLSNNTWNDLYPSGGNYWSDYTGVDVKNGPSQNLHGSDGMGDTPYIIDADNVDHYPLMNPYGAPPPPTYALTITATVGGTTDPSLGTYSYTANSSVQVTAIPNADYTFDHWELDTVTINVYMGISYDPNYTGGLLVTSIVPGGPADKAGLKVGDVIKQVDSLQVNRAEDLIIYVERYKNPGDTVVLEINRNNLIIQITLTLERAPIGSPNPYTVLMDNNHTLKAVFTYSPPPPQLTASISPLSASILVGQSVTFTSTISGGYSPYNYQWYLNGNPVSGATAASWTFTSTTSGIHYVHLKVTDDKGNTAQSETARITVATVPVGGYSFPIQVPTKAEPVLPYIALMATLTAIFTKMRPKTKRKR